MARARITNFLGMLPDAMDRSALIDALVQAVDVEVGCASEGMGQALAAIAGAAGLPAETPGADVAVEVTRVRGCLEYADEAIERAIRGNDAWPLIPASIRSRTVLKRKSATPASWPATAKTALKLDGAKHLPALVELLNAVQDMRDRYVDGCADERTALRGRVYTAAATVGDHLENADHTARALLDAEPEHHYVDLFVKDQPDPRTGRQVWGWSCLTCDEEQEGLGSEDAAIEASDAHVADPAGDRGASQELLRTAANRVDEAQAIATSLRLFNMANSLDDLKGYLLGRGTSTWPGLDGGSLTMARALLGPEVAPPVELKAPTTIGPAVTNGVSTGLTTAGEIEMLKMRMTETARCCSVLLGALGGTYRAGYEEMLAGLKCTTTATWETGVPGVLLQLRPDAPAAPPESPVEPLDYSKPGDHHDNQCERRSGHEWPSCGCYRRFTR